MIDVLLEYKLRSNFTNYIQHIYAFMKNIICKSKDMDAIRMFSNNIYHTFLYNFVGNEIMVL